MGRPRIHANPSERAKAWKEANRERALEHGRNAARRWRERYPDRYAAMRAAERNAYGLTEDDIDRMYADQEGRCGICGVIESDRRHAIDHDHATGVVRGLLCRKCNMAIGLFGDSPDTLRSALAYMEKPR